ncbi:hypothetical protein DPMN_016903 [Dreissena polymorpha]|uniref:Glutamyl-tRNA(Gln) amidotransferase subunit C, mitochondrial n=1 Tax=Dreissena polymorpha TaxID=45954 RepID=A0A9D4NC57_DREPO|nr:hypothetical protein DPMN_016903 [Dreissena polymorpha]
MAHYACMFVIRSNQICSRLLNRQLFQCREKFKLPDKPEWIEIDPKALPPETVLDDSTIQLIERLSLVDFNNKEGVERLKSAIKYADQLCVVNTEGLEPMYSVQEHEELFLDEDVVREGNCKQEILRNAVKVEEDYFVTPPGNIPLKQKKLFDKEGS